MNIGVKEKTKHQLKLELALTIEGCNVIIDWCNATEENGIKRFPVTCNNCNDTTTRTLPSLQKRSFACLNCLKLKYTEKLLTCGFQYISRQNQIISDKCAACQTIQQIRSSVIVSGSRHRCRTCLEQEWVQLASEGGFDFIGQADDRLSFNIRCRKHLIEESVTRGSLYNAKLQCEECRVEKHRFALKAKGCEFVSAETKNHGSIRVKMITYRNSNGDRFEAASSAVLQGSFATTLDTHWTTNHSTYLIVNDFQGIVYCKIGTAIVPSKRLEKLKLLGKSKVFTLSSFKDRFEADALESKLHKEFKIFKLDPDIAKKFTTHKIRRKLAGHVLRVDVKEGVTEWFTHEVYDILKTRYNLKEQDNGINSNPTNQVNYSG